MQQLQHEVGAVQRLLERLLREQAELGAVVERMEWRVQELLQADGPVRRRRTGNASGPARRDRDEEAVPEQLGAEKRRRLEELQQEQQQLGVFAVPQPGRETGGDEGMLEEKAVFARVKKWAERTSSAFDGVKNVWEEMRLLVKVMLLVLEDIKARQIVDECIVPVLKTCQQYDVLVEELEKEGPVTEAELIRALKKTVDNHVRVLRRRQNPLSEEEIPQGSIHQLFTNLDISLRNHAEFCREHMSQLTLQVLQQPGSNPEIQQITAQVITDTELDLLQQSLEVEPE